MPRRVLRLLCLAGAVAAALVASSENTASARTPPNLAKYVNPFSGTDAGASGFGIGGGAGNTYPGATRPFGMLNWSPDSTPSIVNSPGGYSYPDTKLRGFSLTHLSGTGCPVYQDIPFLPTTTAVDRSPVAPKSTDWDPGFIPSLSHAKERARPGYYQVRLDPGTPKEIQSELTVTTRSGLGRFAFPPTRNASMLINSGGSRLANSVAHVRIHPTRREVTGSAEGGRFCGNRNTYRVYFAARFDRSFGEFGTWWRHRLRPESTSSTDTSQEPHSTAQAGAYLTFDARQDRAVRLKVAISYVSAAAARRNLHAESRGWDFAAKRAEAAAAWNRLLNRARVAGGSLARMRMYYTALYHALLSPRTFSDADGAYMGMDHKIHSQPGRTKYTDFSGWDIYRTQIPLLAMLIPGRTGDMMQSLVNDARESGCLPKWSVANGQTNTMVGDPADLIISGADALGVRGYDRRAAMTAMLRGANEPCQSTVGGPYVQREALAEYLRLGYIPEESNSPLPPVGPGGNSAGAWGAGATTLEYTAADFAIAQLAGRLGDAPTARSFLRRAGNWRKLFNATTGYIQQRSAAGAFRPGYDPAGGDGFVEGSGGQYTWAVPYDVAGLIKAMGGRQVATERLDAFFSRLNAGPRSNHAYLGNEPTLGTPWLYAWLGQPYKTQRIVRAALLRLYDTSPKGYPGNDDLGTMSAWYVLSALGLYPAIPGTDVLTLGSPLFPRAHVRLGRRVLRIRARAASDAGPYVHRVSLRGACVGRPWLRWSALRRGGTLDFLLANKPSTAWGVRRSDAPPSFSTDRPQLVTKRSLRSSSQPGRGYHVRSRGCSSVG